MQIFNESKSSIYSLIGVIKPGMSETKDDSKETLAIVEKLLTMYPFLSKLKDNISIIEPLSPVIEADLSGADLSAEAKNNDGIKSNKRNK